MQPDFLFPSAENITPSKGGIKLYLYADEIKRSQNRIGESWMYLGLLIVNEDNKKQLFDYLMQARKEANYYGELHFGEIRKSSNKSEKTLLGKKWSEIVLSENKERIVNFHVLGLNLSNLQYQSFGEEKKERARNIYNRFFRSITKGCLKYYFPGYKRIFVNTLFHDRNELENDELFDWHTIWRIEMEEENISFDDRNICFVDSDHQKEKNFPTESHFIQLTDLILGATSQCLDCGNNRVGCIEIGKLFLPLVERLNDQNRVNNPNSRYSYYRKCCLSFFPKGSLTLEQLANNFTKLRSGFYRNRLIILKEKLNCQRKLF